MISDLRTEKGGQEFGVRINDLWQWDRESSGSSPDGEQNKSNKNMGAAKSFPRKRSAQKASRPTCEHKDKIQKHSIKGPLYGDTKLESMTKPLATPKSKPDCFSQQRWHSLRADMFADLSYGEWAYHCQRKAMWWSPSLYKVFDMEPNKKGTKLADYARLIHPEDRDLLQFLFDRAVNNGVNYTVTHRCIIQREKGTKIIWCHCKCRVYYGSGKLKKNLSAKEQTDKGSSDDSPKGDRYLVGVVQDVTSIINDSDASENLKSYINNQEVHLEHTLPLGDNEILNANPVCRLS
uniref:PAS fold-3 domain-containing protein n=1 Tax=Lotharella oceanica TaxID=641309 RepID=A0A7S2U3C8_9EUKA|mmetsp:Transcript_6650/g.13183  ORF Transcript_6650/g.13183 Transcript_6650/m.13183 type:complete len:292 (+) Transcript_6650:99-974(+)